MIIEPCSDEELKAFGEMIAWCYKNKQQVFTHRHIGHDPDMHMQAKPKKRLKPSWVRQKERAAIEKLLSLGQTR